MKLAIAALTIALTIQSVRLGFALADLDQSRLEVGALTYWCTRGN